MWPKKLVLYSSAGCGRTGAVCAIDYAWELLKSGVSILSLAINGHPCIFYLNFESSHFLRTYPWKLVKRGINYKDQKCRVKCQWGMGSDSIEKVFAYLMKLREFVILSASALALRSGKKIGLDQFG